MYDFKYNEETTFDVQKISFYLRNVRYEGYGSLDWDPNKGFHLEGIVKPKHKLKRMKKLKS